MGGFTTAGLDRVWHVAEEHTRADRVPGMVVLVASGGQVQAEAFGVRGLGRPPMTRDTVFRIASTTKPVTAACTLALARAGLLDLDDPVDRLLPELAGQHVLRRPDGPLDDTEEAARPPTVRDLLTFTFGFGLHAGMFAGGEPWPVVLECEGVLGLSTLGPPDPQRPPDPDTWVARFGSLPLLAQPGRQWLYNTGSALLGIVNARAGGDTYDVVLRDRVLEPLLMADTAFWCSDTDRLATGYVATGDGLAISDPPGGDWSRPSVFPDGAAGLVSTADDLCRFARMLMGGGGSMLDAHQVAAMTSDQLTPAQKAVDPAFGPDTFTGRSWGYGTAVRDDGSYGWDGGLGTSFLVDPRRDLVTVVLTQRMFESPETPVWHTDIQSAACAALA